EYVMNTTDFLRCAGVAIALALCSGCASGPGVAPSNANSANKYSAKTLIVNGRAITAERLNLGGLPRYPATVLDATAKSKSKDFDYIINLYGTYASIFDYPKSTKQIGTITDVGGQGCTNVLYGYGKKKFWIVAGSDQITEYEVPQKPLKTLSTPDGSMPSSCAMDSDGDLAVGDLHNGDVIIYQHAKGTGNAIPSPLFAEYFDGYDDKGNLFFDGFDINTNVLLEELPKGSNTVRPISTSNTIRFPGSVQWDGKYLTVFDQRTNEFYQYKVKGTRATLKHTVALSGSSDCAQTWIATGVVYCGDAGNDNGEVFKYPAGGSPVAILTGNFDEPLGAVAVEK
ncbi:MAG: hypothetical protein ABI431_06280, partial [Candidatus Tumulicola sp.]